MSLINQNKANEGFFKRLGENPATDDFIKGLWKDNPVFVQVLGMCPSLAVSNSAMNALAMGLATTFVLTMSNVLISLRNHPDASGEIIPQGITSTFYLA